MAGPKLKPVTEIRQLQQICRACRQALPLDAYIPGYQICRTCDNARRRARYAKIKRR